MNSLRYRVWHELDIEARAGRGMSIANKILIVSILLSVSVVVLETEQNIRSQAPNLFVMLKTGFGVLFVIEYVVRIWAMGERHQYAGLIGRFKYAVTPVALIDLIAVAPFVLEPFLPSFDGTDFYIFRLLRLFRVVMLARTGPFSEAAREVWKSIADRRYELAFSSVIAIAMMVVSATLLYMAERTAQPEAFGSIPRAMWWAIATLTTVGYGDVYPVTMVGKVLAGIVALSGIGLVAMPAGILASALSSAYQERKSHPVRDRSIGESERHQSGLD